MKTLLRAIVGLCVAVAAATAAHALPMPELEQVDRIEISFETEGSLAEALSDHFGGITVTGREDIAAFLDAVKAVQPSQGGWPKAGDPLFRGSQYADTEPGMLEERFFQYTCYQQIRQVLTLYGRSGEIRGIYALSHLAGAGSGGPGKEEPALLVLEWEQIDLSQIREHPVPFITQPEAANITPETLALYRGDSIDAFFTLTGRFLNAYVPDQIRGDNWFVYDHDAGVCAKVYYSTYELPLGPVSGEIGQPLPGVNQIVAVDASPLGVVRDTYTFHEGGLHATGEYLGKARWDDRRIRVDQAQYKILRENIEGLYRQAPKYAAAFFAAIPDCHETGDLVAGGETLVTHGGERWEKAAADFAGISLCFLPVIPESRRKVAPDAQLHDPYRVQFHIGEQAFDAEVTPSELLIRGADGAEIFRFAEQEAVKSYLTRLEYRTSVKVPAMSATLDNWTQYTE